MGERGSRQMRTGSHTGHSWATWDIQASCQSPESIMCRVRLSDNGRSVGRSSVPQSLSRSVNHRGREGGGESTWTSSSSGLEKTGQHRPAQSRGMWTNKHAGRQCQHLQNQNWNEVTTNQSSIFALCFDLCPHQELVTGQWSRLGSGNNGME